MGKAIKVITIRFLLVIRLPQGTAGPIAKLTHRGTKFTRRKINGM